MEERDDNVKPTWQVREEDDESGIIPGYSIDDPITETPLELLERITTQLKRTHSIAQLLLNAECPSKRTIHNTIFVISGLIEESIEDSENMRIKMLDQKPPRYG